MKSRAGDGMPGISVVMPVYNGERYVERAIRSVMAQTFGDWELIVVDDGSTDHTCAIVEALAAEDGRIRPVKNGENLGAARSRNRGMDLCRGDFVALLDGDDLWRPEKLARQRNLAERTGADIVYCSYGIIGPDGRNCCRDHIVPETTDFRSTLVRSEINCSTALLNRRVAERCRFPEGYMHEDLALWLELLGDGCSARGIPEVLADYRVTVHGRTANKLRAAWGRWEIYRKKLGFSLPKSLGLLWRYGIFGLQKYWRVKK